MLLKRGLVQKHCPLVRVYLIFEISRRSLQDSCRQLKKAYLILLRSVSAQTINNTRTEQYASY